MAFLLRCVHDVSTCNLALVHQFVDLLQLAQAAGLEWCLDETTAEELDGFGGVASIADVRTLDGNHLDDRLEDRCAEIGSSGETDSNDRTSWSNVLSSR